MNYNDLYNGQKGITPVVAIVMLLMLTIAVVGGAFAFINGYIGDQLTEASQQANADITIRDVTCYSSSYSGGAGTANTIDIVVDNTGDIDLDRSQTSIHLRRVSDDTYLEELSFSQTSVLSPNDSPWQETLSPSSASLTQGQTYKVNFEFDEVSGARSGTCNAQ